MQTRWIPVTAGIAVFIAGGTATGAMAQVPPAAPTPMPATVIAPAPRSPVSVAVVAPRAPVAITTYRDHQPLPELSRQGDPADSLYRAARNALQRGRYREAADIMRDLRNRYPKSSYVADSYYWEAYALSRTSGSSEWRRAASVLDEQASKYPDAAAKGDARSLRAEVSARLARGGDAAAAEDVTRIAVSAATPVPPRAPKSPRAPRPPRGGVAGGVRSHNECDDEDDVQSAALQGLLRNPLADPAVIGIGTISRPSISFSLIWTPTPDELSRTAGQWGTSPSSWLRGATARQPCRSDASRNGNQTVMMSLSSASSVMTP